MTLLYESPRVLNPFRFVVIAVAGWMNQRYLHVTGYLRHEDPLLDAKSSSKSDFV